MTLLACSGLVVSLGFLGLRAGSLDGWFDVQREWDSTSDWGGAKARYVLDNLGSGAAVHQVAAWTLLIACLLFAAGVAVRIPWQLSVYAGILLAGVLVRSVTTSTACGFCSSRSLLSFPWRGPFGGGRGGWWSRCSGRWRCSPRRSRYSSGAGRSRSDRAEAPPRHVPHTDTEWPGGQRGIRD